LGALVKFGLLRVVHVEGDDACADEELEDPAGGDHRGEAQLHESTSVGCQDDPHPVEGVAALRPEHPVDGYLAADEVDEEGDGRVEDFLFVVDVASRPVDVGEQLHGRLQHVENAESHDFNYIITCRHNAIYHTGQLGRTEGAEVGALRRCSSTSVQSSHSLKKKLQLSISSPLFWAKMLPPSSCFTIGSPLISLSLRSPW
jgi:hypothetical protein